MPRKPKSPSSKTPRPDALLNMLESLDPQDLARLRDALLGEAGVEAAEATELVDEFLRRLQTPGDTEIVEDEALIDDVVSALMELAVERRGGDARAREVAAAIDERLDKALVGESLDPASLVLIAKVLTDAKWTVPHRLKTKLVEALDAAPSGETNEFDLAASLRQIAEAAEDDAFAAYEALSSVLSAFPTGPAARMVGVLAEGREPVLLQTLAGFVMHAETPLAIAAIAALKGASAARPVESALVERLVRMRPWLSGDRQGPLDEAIRALRGHAAPPREMERSKPLKCFVMACDGMGSGGALASLKGDGGWGFYAAMTRTDGIAEVMGLDGARKAEVDATLRGMRESVVTAETDPAGIGRYLQLCLGENLAAHNPPPFRLVSFVERLGLGPLAPRALSAGDLIEELLAGAEDVGPEGLAKAHTEVVRSEAAQSWFEAGEPVERLLKSVRGAKPRAKALLRDYLPQRRDFWARVCAMSAFAMDLDLKGRRTLGRSLARVGREILSGAPLESIPLMQSIAETTVAAFDSHLAGGA